MSSGGLGTAQRRLLGACSLVSKSWLPRSRYRLFGEVALQSQRTMDLLDLLGSSLSTIAPYVRTLKVEEEWDQDNYGDPRWLDVDVLLKLSVIHALETLFIYKARFDTMDTQSTSSFFASFHKLQTMQFRHCTFSTQLFDTLHPSPTLECVGLFNLQIAHAELLPGHKGPPPPGLKRLVFASSGHLLKWLASGTQMPPVDTLELHSIAANDSQAIASFTMRALGASLNKLTPTQTWDRPSRCALVYEY
jgi:hypothetical protein